MIYLDHRGQGRSDQRDDPSHWNIDTWAEDVVRFCAALEIEHPVLLGNSFGGMVAMAAAGRHPDLASKAILSSTAARQAARHCDSDDLVADLNEPGFPHVPQPRLRPGARIIPRLPCL